MEAVTERRVPPRQARAGNEVVDAGKDGLPRAAEEPRPVRRATRFVAVFALSVGCCSFPSLVSACAVCDSELGRQVRAGVFNSEFAPTTLAVLAPFPLFVLAALLVRFALPLLMAPSDKPREQPNEMNSP